MYWQDSSVGIPLVCCSFTTLRNQLYVSVNQKSCKMQLLPQRKGPRSLRVQSGLRWRRKLINPADTKGLHVGTSLGVESENTYLTLLRTWLCMLKHKLKTRMLLRLVWEFCTEFFRPKAFSVGLWALEGFQHAEKSQLFHLTSNVLTPQHTCT